MTKEDKSVVIEGLKQKFSEFDYFYVTDSSALTVDQINKFRKFCFEKGVDYKVVKNTLIAKALQSLATDYTEFTTNVLKGSSGIIFSQNGKLPAQILTEFKATTKIDKIKFKGASIDSSFFIGEKALDQLVMLKSKQELVGDIIAALQAPAKNVIGALTSGGSKLAGILKTLEEKKAA